MGETDALSVAQAQSLRVHGRPVLYFSEGCGLSVRGCDYSRVRANSESRSWRH